MHGIRPLPEFKKIAKSTRYKHIFFLEQIAEKKDEIRTESKEEIDLIAQHTYNAYRSLGFILIRVPIMGKNKRVDFILTHIKKNDYSTISSSNKPTIAV